MNELQNRLEKRREEKRREEKRREEKRREYVGIKQATQQGYAVMEVGGVADFLYPTSKLRRGRVQGGGQISPTITAENSGVCKVEKNENYSIENGVCWPSTDITQPTSEDNEVDWSKTEYRIRKLTPFECFKLMDVTEEDSKTMLKTNSNTQCYKTAGNSIVVSVLCAVFSQLSIQGIKKWNDRTLEEQYDLTALGRS